MRQIKNILSPALAKTYFCKATFKVMLGCVLLFIAYILKNDPDWEESLIKDAAYTIGSAAIMGGLLELIDNTLIWSTNKIITTSHEERHAEVYYRVRKYQNIFINSFHSISMTLMLNRYLDAWAWLPNNASVFSLSFQESPEITSSNPIFSFFHAPWIIPVFVALSIIGVFYNAKEIFMNLNSESPRQSDPPFFGLLNALSQVGLSAVVIRRLIPSNQFTFTINPQQNLTEQITLMQQAIEDHMTTPKLAHLVSWLNSAAAYQAYQNFVTLFFNGVYAFVARPSIRVEDITPLKHKKSKQHKRRSHTPQTTKSSLFQPAIEDTGTIHRSRIAEEEGSSTTIRYKKPKIKMRGKTNQQLSDQEAESKPIETLPDILYQPNSDQRIEKLDLIAEYRTYSQIKMRFITKEINQLTQFLPKGKIKNISGSEHALIWKFNNKRYHLKYETPHGTNSQYQGRKLKKILNILETGYLWGWGQKNIQNYLAKNSGFHYLGTLIKILLERPQFEEFENCNKHNHAAQLHN